MFHIAWKETRTNAFFLLFVSLGLSVLLGIVFALSSFSEQMPSSYLERFEDVEYVTLESSRREVLDAGIDGLFLYGKCTGVTYDVTVSFGEAEVEIPGYESGFCVYSVNDKLPVIQYLTEGTDFSETEDGIWLAEELREALGCEIGSEINLGVKKYTVSGVYDNLPGYYSRGGAFVLYCSPQNAETVESLTAVVEDPKQLTALVKLDDGRMFEDEVGALELSRGYNLLCYGMDGITLFMAVLMAVFLVSMVRMYLMRRQEYFRILHRSGISAGRLGGFLFFLFAEVSVFSCALATIWNYAFYSLIDMWAKDFLHIILDSQAYLVQFLLGIALCCGIVILSLLFLLRRRSYRWEVANR